VFDKWERTQKLLGPARFDTRELRVQFANYQLIVDVNSELFDKNVVGREELAAKFRAAQVLLDRLEQSGGKEDYVIMVDDANQMVSEICDCIKLMQSQDIP
jgi:hypothetical protein